jgi:NTP pyrophosphatase (non-canonical NTP hydrolase)
MTFLPTKHHDCPTCKCTDTPPESDVFKNIDQWFEGRGFFDYKELYDQIRSKQMMKLAEEMGELAGNIVRGKLDDAKDDIGDMAVVLVGLARLCGHDFRGCCEHAYGEIKDRNGRMVNGAFIKEEDL